MSYHTITEWVERTVNNDQKLIVSNPKAPVPEQSIHFVQDFLTAKEEQDILLQVNEKSFAWEGFDQKRRVQRLEIDKAPAAIQQVGQRLYEATNLRPDSVVLEEYNFVAPKSFRKQGDFSSNHIVTTFESLSVCRDDQCSCHVALVPLRATAIQHWNRPAKRQPHCWSLTSKEHWLDIKMPQRSLLLYTGDFLWNWRNRLVAAEQSTKKDENDETILWMLKFCSLPAHGKAEDDDTFGYIPNVTEDARTGPVPPLPDALTIIITTSPIQSHPSTEVLERSMATFLRCGTDFAYRCRKIIVCDGYRPKEEGKVSKKHGNARQAMRNGIVTDDQAENYRLFKQALKDLCATATTESVFSNATVVELESRHGYGFALRHALGLVETPFVCVIQHDRTFMRTTPMAETVATMWNHPRIKYVGMSMRSNLQYRDIFLSKYGRSYYDELDNLVLRLPELQVDSKVFGPDSESTKEMLDESSDKLRRNLISLVETYRGSFQHQCQEEWVQRHRLPDGKHQLTLTPTLYWYDNVHVVETAHYRDFVFHPPYKMVARGGFVEDKLSPVLIRTVERLGLVEGHARFGCYLLDDHSGMFFTGHLDGGSYMTDAQRQELLASSQRQPANSA